MIVLTLASLLPGQSVALGVHARLKVLDNGIALEIMGSDAQWHEQARWTEPIS